MKALTKIRKGIAGDGVEEETARAVEPEMKISIVRVKAQPRKHKVISYGYRKLVDGEVPEMYRFQYLPDPDLPEDLHPGVIPAGFSACVPVDQDMVYFHTREGDTGPEYQVVYTQPDPAGGDIPAHSMVLEWTNDVDAIWVEALQQLEDNAGLSEEALNFLDADPLWLFGIADPATQRALEKTAVVPMLRCMGHRPCIEEWFSYLNADEQGDAPFRWVVESFAEVELPEPWTSFKGVGSVVCYLNNETNETTWKHPFYDYFAQLLNHCRRSTNEEGLWRSLFPAFRVGAMPAPEMRPSEYENILRQELTKLQEVLLKQHQLEVARKVDLTFCLAKDDPRGLDARGSIDDEDVGIRMVPMEYHTATFDDQQCETEFESGYAKCMQWQKFTLRLLYGEADSQRAQLALEEDRFVDEEDLQLRPAWNISWQEASKTHRSRNLMGSVRKTHSLKMNEYLWEDTCLGRLVLPPRSKPQMLWTLLGSLFILWDLITIPLEFFQLSDQVGIFTVMGRITMGFWMLDMPMNLFFGVETQGKTEMRILPLARIYFRSYFFLDLAVVSIDVALLMVEFFGEETSDGFRSARFLRTMRLLRLLRLLRAVKLQQELTLLANRFLSVHVFMVAKVVMGLIMMLLVNHIIACLWYGMGSWIMLETGNSWIVRSNMADAGFTESYAASMHWTLTQFNPATNDIAPNSALERLFAVWVILLAMGVFSSFISSITATVSSLRASQAKQFSQRASLLRFFCERNLSADLYGKVEDVLRKEGMFQVRVQETEVELIRGIPETLHQQLHEEMFMAMLTQLRVWPSWAHTEDFHFLRTVCHFCMVEHIAKPMQDAFLPGRTCTEVFIIETGRLCYAPNGKGEVEVDEGEVLCLPTLWAEWKYKGRLCATYGAAYYVGVSSQKFCEVAAEHGGPLWQYLHILGILLLGSIESTKIRTDLTYPETLLELGERATKYAAIFNSRIGLKGSLNRSKSGSKESVLSNSFRPVMETMETFEKLTESKVARNDP